MSEIQTTDKRASTLKKIIIGLGVAVAVVGGAVIITDEKADICFDNFTEQVKTDLGVNGNCITEREYKQLKTMVIQKVEGKNFEPFETSKCDDKEKCNYKLNSFLSLFFEISDRELKKKNNCEVFIFKDMTIEQIIDNVNAMLESPPKPQDVNVGENEIKKACFTF